MNFGASRATVERIRQQYPVGCRVELVFMDDPYAPQVGTQGIVLDVDDIGTIHVQWEDGNSLGVAYGEDSCRRVYE